MIYRISTLNLSIFIDYLEISCFVLFIACISKSAQFIFHIWLPEAMEGPTPVSSLLHAATMVTLGIFIILRMSNIFAQVPSLSLYMMLIGASTIFVASVINVLQTDLKKVVAYSTCSQLGYMFIGCGIGDYIDTIYQLFLHAFFKSMLFLSAGYLIYVCSSEQDIRKIGGLLKLVPLIYVIFFCGTISSIGYFSYGNAYSKEVLLELLGST